MLLHFPENVSNAHAPALTMFLCILLFSTSLRFLFKVFVSCTVIHDLLQVSIIGWKAIWFVCPCFSIKSAASWKKISFRILKALFFFFFFNNELGSLGKMYRNLIMVPKIEAKRNIPFGVKWIWQRLSAFYSLCYFFPWPLILEVMIRFPNNWSWESLLTPK